MLKKFLHQYSGLRREMYIIFWGRVVTNMGALIWPMLTLILKNKLGYTAGEAANLMLLVGILQLPCTLIGGKMADRFDKKKIIVFCDLVTVLGYFLCAVLPMDRYFILIFCIAGIFAQIEWPSYDALVANLSTPKDRERAYSLNYLGANLGLVLAPTIGGFLFENHLPLAFFISGAATLSSTILIFLFVHDTTAAQEDSDSGHYEAAQSELSTRKIFAAAPVLLLFLLCMGLRCALYNVGFGFLMPLNIEELFSAKGAVLFGTLSSVNALVVIIGTPLLTGLMTRIRDSEKLGLGVLLEVSGYICFVLSGQHIPLYYVAIIIFTLGEILLTLGKQPYITHRVPSSHRGRMSSVNTVIEMLFMGIFLYAVGRLADHLPLWIIWAGLIGAGVFDLILLGILRIRDKAQFPLLYTKKD